MMISTQNVGIQKSDEEPYTESDLDEEELGEEEEELLDDEELEDEEYSEEIMDQYEDEIRSPVPKTFEQFHNMYKPQSEHLDEEKRKVKFDEPKAVEQEVEKEVEERILAMPTASSIVTSQTPEEAEKEPQQGEVIEEFDPEMDVEDEEIDLEEEEYSGKFLLEPPTTNFSVNHV